MQTKTIVLALICCLVLAGAITHLRFSGRMIVIKRMYVRTVDADGKQIGDGKWVDIPEPDHFPNHGFDHLQFYLSRLLASPAPFASLTIFTPDGQRGFALHHRGKQTEISLIIDWRREPAKEAKIRDLFRVLGVSATQDYVAGNGPIPDATRVLNYPLGGDAHEISTLCQRIFSEIYGVTPEDGLDITYQHHKDA